MNSQNKTTSFKKSAVASAITAALLFSVGGHTEESEDESAKKNNVITVTANRREQSIQKVPFNISAINGDFLNDAQITDAAELMRSIAGVAVVDRGHRNSGVINGVMIRGLNVDGSALGDFALSAVPTVSTYVNDTPVYANFILKDINRVEILRGPQSTLYGSGSLGGTVKYLLNRPELGEFSGKVTAGMSSTSGSSSLSWDTDIILNIPLSDSVAIRFVGGKVDYAGITDYVNVYELDDNRIPIAPDGIFATTESTRSVKDADTVDIEHARISLLVEPNEQFSALFSYQTQSDDIGGRRQQTVGLNGFGESYADNEIGSVILEPSSREIDLSSLEMDFDLGFATLTSSTSQYDHRGDSISENTGFYAQNNWLSDFYYNYPRPLAEASRSFSDKAFVQELRIVSNGESNIDYVAGIFYQDQDLISTQDSYLRGFTIWADAAFGFSATTGDKDFEYRRDQNFKDKAVFGEITYHFTDDYRMTFGGRFFSNKSVNNTEMTVGLYRAFSPTDSGHFVEKDKGSLFKVNFAYDLAENQMLYGTISEGYRRGGTNAVPLVGTFAESPTWQTFDPDTVTNYELGIKGRSGSMNYSLSAFYVDWQDIQINTATTIWGFFAAQNGGDASTKGIEVEIDGYFGNDEQWHYGFGYTYVDASLDGDVFTPDDLTQSFPIALKGTTLPGAAKNTISASLTNTQNLSNGLYWVNRLGYYYQSGTENAISSSERFKQHFGGFSIVDFSSSISKDEWTATLWVKNLTNEEGTTGAFKEQYMGTSPAQNYNGNGSKEFLALPRTIGLTVSYEF